MPDVCVVGLGAVGAPLAAWLLDRGRRVHGADTAPEVLDAIRAGRLDAQEPGVAAILSEAITAHALTLSATPAPAPVIIVAVPTWPPTAEDDGLSALRAALDATLPHLPVGGLLIIESTLPPGATRGLIADTVRAHGRHAGQDCFVAHCPERVLPGDALRELRANPRLIGGLTPACADAARGFYSPLVDGQLLLTSPEVAELTKLAENAYRDVNIALANELAQLGPALGVDIMQVFELANTHPRVQLHRPGVGVGGPCLPLATATLTSAHPRHPDTLLQTARHINASQPHLLAERISAFIRAHDIGRATIIGLTYKPDSADARQSPALDLLGALARLAPDTTTLTAHDPHLPEPPPALPSTVRYTPDLSAALQHAELVICAVAHEPYRALTPAQLSPTAQRVDLCGAWSPATPHQRSAYPLLTLAAPWP